MSNTTSPHLDTIVYSCSFRNYDWTFGPLATTAGAKFVRYGDTRAGYKSPWECRPVPKRLEQGSQVLTNRYCKLFPHLAVEPCDVAVYVDGNILIKSSLTPLIQEFWESGADIALFPHPSGRTVSQELDFSLIHTIPNEHQKRACQQKAKYRALNLLDMPITENTIIFYRMSSKKLQAIGALWWKEMQEFTRRDQISLPYVLHKTNPKVYIWDWHFDNKSNPYFRRCAHKHGSFIHRIRTTAFFMKDYSLRYRIMFNCIKGIGSARRFVRAITSRESKL